MRIKQCVISDGYSPNSETTSNNQFYKPVLNIAAYLPDILLT